MEYKSHYPYLQYELPTNAQNTNALKDSLEH